ETLQVHTDAVKKGDRVLVVDDLIATGGTAKAACNLIERLGGSVVGAAFLIELADMQGREKLEGKRVLSLAKY
ncbi:MAG: phosphoribosyltransferase family protein, partial [Candidatus Micrarchaeia archaeon]